jgi:hypothetical protein
VNYVRTQSWPDPLNENGVKCLKECGINNFVDNHKHLLVSKSTIVTPHIIKPRIVSVSFLCFLMICNLWGVHMS